MFHLSNVCFLLRNVVWRGSLVAELVGVGAAPQIQERCLRRNLTSATCCRSRWPHCWTTSSRPAPTWTSMLTWSTSVALVKRSLLQFARRQQCKLQLRAIDDRRQQSSAAGGAAWLAGRSLEQTRSAEKLAGKRTTSSNVMVSEGF